MTVAILDQLIIDLNNPINCNSDLQKKLTQQITKLTKEPKKIQKTTTRRTTSATTVSKTKQELEVPDAEVNTLLNQILNLCYENLFTSSKTTKFNINKKPLPPILCWSNLGLLSLSKLEGRGYFNDNNSELISLKWKFYWILSEVNTQALTIKDCDNLYHQIQSEINDIEEQSPLSPLGSKRKLKAEAIEPNTINNPICFNIKTPKNLPNPLLESIIGYQSLKINQIVRLKLTSLLSNLSLELNHPGSPYEIFEIANDRELQKSLTQLARSYLLLVNYIIDHNLLPFTQLYNILETSILAYIKSKLTPQNNIFTMLYKFQITQDKDELRLLNLNKLSLKTCKLMRIQLSPSDYFLPWFSNLLELIIKNSNLQTYNSLINWVKSKILEDSNLLEFERNLLEFCILNCESLSICYNGILEKKLKCQKLTNLTITLYDLLPKIQNSIYLTESKVYLSKFNTIMYRMSKVIKAWLLSYQILNNNQMGEIEVAFTGNLLKLWTKLFNYIGDTYSKDIILNSLGQQLDSFLLSFISNRINSNSNLSSQYLELIKSTYKFLNYQKFQQIIKISQDNGIIRYNSKDWFGACNWFELAIELGDYYLSLNSINEKDKLIIQNLLQNLKIYLTKAKVKLGDLKGIAGTCFNSLMEELENNQYFNNIWEILDTDSILVKLGNFIKVNLQTKDYKVDYLLSNLMERFNVNSNNGNGMELIIFLLIMEIKLILNINSNGTKYELAYNLCNQLNSIIDKNSFPLLKALVLLNLSELEYNLTKLNFLRGFSNELNGTKLEVLSEEMNPLINLNNCKLTLELKTNFDNTHESQLYKLILFKSLALDYLLDLHNFNLNYKKLENLIKLVEIGELSVNDQLTKLNNNNKNSSKKNNGIIITNLASDLIESIWKIINLLKLNYCKNYFNIIKSMIFIGLDLISLSTKDGRGISLKLFLELSWLLELEGYLSEPEEIIRECEVLLNKDNNNEDELEFKALYWSKRLSYFNSKRNEIECQLAITKIKSITYASPVPNTKKFTQITLPLTLSLSQYYLTIGNFFYGLELSQRSLYSSYNLLNTELGKLIGFNKVHRGDYFDLKWFELSWKLNELEYFEYTSLSLQLLIEAQTLKGNHLLTTYILQKSLEIVKLTNLPNLILNFNLLGINLKSKKFEFKECEFELDELIVGVNKSLRIEEVEDSYNPSNKSKIWEIKAKNELREFKFLESSQSFNRSYDWLIKSKSYNNTSANTIEGDEENLSIERIFNIKNNLIDILPTAKSNTVSSWWWTELINGLALKKQLLMYKEALKLDNNNETQELDINLKLTLAKAEFIKGISKLDKLHIRDNLMNCYWTSPKIINFKNIKINSKDSGLEEVKTYLISSHKLLASLLPSCYYNSEYKIIRDIVLTLTKLKFILELITTNEDGEFKANTLQIINNLTLSKGIWFNRTKLDISLNPAQNLRSSNNWPNIIELDNYEPNINNSKLNEAEIRAVINNYSNIYKFEADKIWDEIRYLLPNKWAIVTLDYIRESNDLLITRIDNYSGLKACRLPLVQHAIIPNNYSKTALQQQVSGYPYSSVISELERIITESVKISKNGQFLKTHEEKKNWWNSRFELDNNLRELLNQIEMRWLSVFKGFLMIDSKPISKFELQKLCDRIRDLIYDKVLRDRLGGDLDIIIDEGLIQIFLRIGNILSLTDCEDILCLLIDTITMNLGIDLNLSESDQSELTSKLFELFQNALNGEIDESRKIDHIILVVDNYLRQIPWENLPCLLNSSISRVPSLSLLRDQLTKLKEESSRFNRDHKKSKGFLINTEKTFFMLNPSRDLVRTQNYFEEALRNTEGWNGAIGKFPNEQTLENNLKESDLYLYFGHGTGELYLRSEKIQILESSPLAILLGCSSGKIKFLGEFEGFGTPLHYLLSNSPAVVANLWDVTDRDIDKFSHKFLAIWGLENFRVLPTIEGDDVMKGISRNCKFSLSESLAKSRSTCVLKYLVGAAPIMYGLPIYKE